VDRYENVKLASFNSTFFIPLRRGHTEQGYAPFIRNGRCYTCFLIANDMPNQFRGPYNEDTDYSLQILAAGYCTILLNAFCIDTPETMTDQGGQTDIYVGDGRLQMSRDLERRWPGVVWTYRRFHRPQHRVHSSWRKFDTPLIRKPDAEIPDEPNNYGLKLKPAAEKIDERLRHLLD
jgi:hypothetical protein